MAYLTQQDIMNLRLTLTGQLQTSRIIEHLIEENEQKNKEMKTGVKYYQCDHKINEREIGYYLDGRWVIDKSKTNNKLVHPFHRNLVDQKVDKILGEPPTITSNDEGQRESTVKLLGKKFTKKLQRAAKGASNKGVEWLHVFIDETGEFRYTITPAETIIPIYDTRYYDNLVELIRYYPVTVIDGKEEKKRWRVEWWTTDQVTYYMQANSGQYFLDASEKINPRPHWLEFNTAFPDREMEGRSWGRVPFIEIRNNDEMTNDLKPIKSLIDDYDNVSSDFSNTLADIQDVIWVLRGYEGESKSEFIRDLKVFKCIILGTEAGTGAEPLSVDIPIAAQKEHLDRLERDIHLFGRGVQMRSDTIGGNPSGVALKFMFAWLDLKCKSLKSWMTLAVNDLFWFATQYINRIEGKKYDADNLDIVYNESFIVNESELIDNIIKSMELLDVDILLAKHPWIEQVTPDIVAQARKLIETRNQNGKMKVEEMNA